MQSLMLKGNAETQKKVKRKMKRKRNMMMLAKMKQKKFDQRDWTKDLHSMCLKPNLDLPFGDFQRCLKDLIQHAMEREAGVRKSVSNRWREMKDSRKKQKKLKNEMDEEILAVGWKVRKKRKKAMK